MSDRDPRPVRGGTHGTHGTLAGAVEAGCWGVTCGCAGARQAAEESAADRAADLADLIRRTKQPPAGDDTGT